MTRLPEFSIIVFSFLLHFVWEFWQAPTYAGMIEMNHWDGIKLCSSATFGDVGFALTAFWITSAAARSRFWFEAPKAWQTLLFIGIGIALTVGFEFITPTYRSAGPTPISCHWCRRSEQD